MALRRRQVDSHMESQIIIGLITNTEYLHSIAKSVDPKYFQSQFLGKIAGMVLEYYALYKEAPGKHIEDMYHTEKSAMKQEEADLIAEFLATLSSHYEENGLNVEYLKDNSMAYFRQRSLDIMTKEIQHLLSVGRQEQAYMVLAEYRGVSKVLSKWVDPFQTEVIASVYERYYEKEASSLFSFDGALGKLVGPLNREWFMAWEAPYKRGKTWWLLYTAMCAMVRGLNVVFVSLEMSVGEVSSRLYNMLTGLFTEPGSYLFPVFDCVHNQNGTCTKASRTGRGMLITESGERLSYNDAPNYIPCCVCKGRPDYEFASWWEPVLKKRTSKTALSKSLKGILTTYAASVRIIAYPATSANISTVLSDLSDLEYQENFVPDVICIDYADILGAEDSRESDRRHRIDATWAALKGLSQKKHCLVATATQTNKQALDRKATKATDVAEDSRKLGHVDLMLALSQTTQEKKRGVMRVNCVMHRHHEFTEDKFVHVLQNLSVGQVDLGSI